MSKSKDAEPLQQLELVHTELNRQRDATVDKHRTMYQRSSLLIGAATLVTGVQAARIPTAISAMRALLSGTSLWEIVHTASALSLAVLATVLALVAAILGIRAIMVETGGEIDIEKLAQNVLGPPADIYTAEWSLVRDKIGVHLGDMRRLEGRRKLFTRGASFLVISWVIAILQFATSEMSFTMANNDSPAFTPVQLPSAPQQPLPSSVSMVIKESGVTAPNR